jgi:hypothetical protein
MFYLGQELCFTCSYKKGLEQSEYTLDVLLLDLLQLKLSWGQDLQTF